MSVNPTETQVAATIRAFEKRTQAFQRRVHGIPLWQLIRFEVSMRLQALNLERAGIGRQRLFAGILKGLWQLLWLPKTEYVGKTFDSAFRRQGKNGFEDVYFEELGLVVSRFSTMSSCDAPGYEVNVGKAATPPAFDDTSVIALSAILGRILPRVRHHTAFEQLSESIRNELGLEYYSPRILSRLYNVFVWRVTLYRIVLARFGARAIMCPDNGQFALIRAAELKGISFVEMQHGVFSGAHPNALPSDLSQEEVNGLLLPSKLAVYGAFAAEQLKNTWLAVNGRIELVGAPLLSDFRALAANKSPNKVPRIALTTQGIGRQALRDFIAQFLRECSADFELIVRLHPAYDADTMFYESAFCADSRVHIQPGTSEISTHSLIASADFHISISSACHFDALGLGTPTGILQLETYESVVEVSKVEGAMLIETPSDLASIVTRREFGVVPQTTSRYFFEPDFGGRFSKLLKNLPSPSFARSAEVPS